MRKVRIAMAPIGIQIRRMTAGALFVVLVLAPGGPLIAAGSILPGGNLLPTPDAWDVVVYGATPAGIAAAIAAARQDTRVALLEPTDHIGGMMASGLGFSDIGNKNSVGGLALHFYRRLGAAYHLGTDAVSWNVTPAMAERTFRAMLAQGHVFLFTGQRLRLPSGVTVRDRRIRAVSMESGRTFSGRVFIDASYDGDLMAAAGVSYVVGREAVGKYGESLAGVRAPQLEMPLVATTARSSALAPGVDRAPLGQLGAADGLIQAYTFRLCVTTVDANQVPFPRPPGYDPARYLLVVRHLAALQSLGRAPQLADVVTINPLPETKADLNAAGPLSTDLVGGSTAFPDASYSQRQRIWDEHYRYEAGLLYFLADDTSVPATVRVPLRRWGLCRDEFVDTGHWPPLLYVREARRMVSDFVLTQTDLIARKHKQDAIGVASYRIDAHATQLLADAAGRLEVEGALSAPISGPYDIPYRVLVPRRSEILNLLDPVTVSASHVALASLRMEPQYMAMGEAAGTAAALASKSGVAVQDVDVAALQALLKAHGAVVRIQPAAAAVGAAPLAPAANPSGPSFGVWPWLVACGLATLALLRSSALRRR